MVGRMPYKYRSIAAGTQTDTKHLLRAERNELMARRTALKRGIRHLVAELGDIEQRIDVNDARESCLHDDD